MAKKKKAAQQQKLLSPEKYIQTKARNLPIVECMFTDTWKEAGITPVMIARQHVSGNYTVGAYLIDTWCLGMKDSFFYFNIDKDEYEDTKSRIFKRLNPVAIGYNEVHNLIYGAIAFAEEIDVQPDKSFRVTQFLLDEDTEDVPLIEYEFGKKGKPFLVATTHQEADKYLSEIEANGHSVEYLVQFENEHEKKIVDDWLSSQDEIKRLPSVVYDYIHPEYPKELHFVHPELQILLSPENNGFLSKEDTEMILSLPRETLVADLEHMIRYEIGQTYDKTDEQDCHSLYISSIIHGLFFLGELRAEESLDTVLEVMRQDWDFSDFHFGESYDEVFPLTLYYVGGNNLKALSDYIKEPDLDYIFRHQVFEVACVVAENHPERRGEVIDWCRDILHFFQTHTNDFTVFDNRLMGMFTIALIELRAVELLPELKKLYATGLVDNMFIGDYEDVEYQILEIKSGISHPLIDIHERYNEYKLAWEDR